jgi:predicted aspartyl protease
MFSAEELILCQVEKTMEKNGMGRIFTEATIENLKDLWQAESGQLAPDKVRRLHVTDALADTGATTLAMPRRYVDQLGLSKRGAKRATSTQGAVSMAMYDAVRLTIMGRDMTVDVMEVADEDPVLIGQIPLEMLDLVIDLQGQRLIGNPAHGGEHMLELY